MFNKFLALSAFFVFTVLVLSVINMQGKHVHASTFQDGINAYLEAQDARVYSNIKRGPAIGNNKE